MNRPRALISAFSCNPEMGSEPGVGHFFILQIAKFCNLTVITEELQNRAAIERLQKNDPAYASIEFRYIPWPLVDRQGNRMANVDPIRYYSAYNLWQKKALALARNIVQESQYDLVHHLTMQGYREPGYLWQLNRPFIWGPAGGHAQIPWAYIPSMGLRGILEHGPRNIFNSLQARFHRRVHEAARRARAIIVNTTAEQREFERFHHRRPYIIPEFGTDDNGSVAPKQRKLDDPLRIVWSGIHAPRKALPILLHAMQLIPEGIKYEAHILGNGPENERWKNLARSLGVMDRCIWHGRLPRIKALEVMAKGDVFVLTSLLDGTSCVLLEAVSNGLPVICHHICGFPDIVDDRCAILVPPINPRASARLFAEAVARLANDKEFYDFLAQNIRVRSSQLTWGRRGQEMRAVYENVLNNSVGLSSMLESANL